MPMPSVVWDYFDEFEGGGKCRLCGCIRNRKDKSTSTFWQHLERVHGLDKRQMLVNSATNNVPCGKLNSNPRPPTTPTGNNANNPIPSPSGKRSSDSIKLSKEDEELTDKMPKLELMADLLDQQATEETFKFISELVKQQQQPMPEAIVSTNPVIEAALEKEREMPAIPKMGNGIFPIGISLNSLEDKEVAKRIFEQIEPTTNQVKDTKNADYEQTPPAEPSPPSLNNESTGSTADLELLDRSSLSPKTSSSCPSKSSPTPPPNKHFLALAKTKSKSPSIAESTADDGKKRMDFINWDEFFMGTAILAAQRSKDPATQVGACIVRENIIVAIGYNGMPIGCPDDEMPWGKCDEDPLKTKYPFVCHAEMNAIMNKNCANLRGATLYTTMFPCNECAKLIIQSQIKRVVFLKTKEGVQMTASRRLLDITGIEYSKFEPIRSEVLIRFN